MSYYTPTTEQVRKAYMYDPEDEYRDPVNAPFRAKENGRQFDRWLAQHDAEVAERALRRAARAPAALKVNTGGIYADGRAWLNGRAAGVAREIGGAS